MLERGGIPSILHPIVAAIFEEENDHGGNEDKSVATEKLYGILEIRYSTVNPALQWGAWPEAVLNAFTNTSGMLRSCGLVFEFLRTQSTSAID